MADYTIKLGKQDQGDPFALKKYRRAILSFRFYSGSPTLTYQVDGLSPATVAGTALSTTTTEGPNLYEFILGLESGHIIELTVNVLGASDARATAEGPGIVEFDVIRKLR